MSALGASDVTYSIVNQRTLADSRKFNRVQITVGDGAKTYSAGGIPLTIAKMGCPVVVESLTVVDKGTSDYSFMYDQSAAKLVVFQVGDLSHTHDIKALGGLTSNEPLLLDSSINFGKNAATNRTIVGSTSANTGGVVSATIGSAAQSEVTSVAIAQQIIEVEVVGW